MNKNQIEGMIEELRQIYLLAIKNGWTEQATYHRKEIEYWEKRLKHIIG